MDFIVYINTYDNKKLQITYPILSSMVSSER